MGGTTRTGAPRRIDVAELVERSRLGRFQLRAHAVLAACLVMDGFDVQAMGYAAPALIREWQIPNARMGPVFSAGLLGLFLGSVLFSMLADRVGRRPVLLLGTLAFAVFTTATAFAGSVAELLGVRFVAGLGLGAIMPNATALVGEYSPARRRIATMMIVTNGFMVGAVLGGFVSAWLIPAYGWRSVFYAGGLAPLAVLAVMFAWLPESLQFLAVRGKSRERLARWAARLDPTAAGDDVELFAPERGSRGLPLLHLFRDGRAAGTALLWTVSFLNVLNAYFVASWLPTVVRDAGRSTSTAVLAGTVVQVGGMAGTFVLGALARRVGIFPLLTACFATAAAALAFVAHPGLPLPLLAATAFALGWGIFGGQPGLNALAATYYPTALRSTGIGAALGVGRLGAIFGPLIASALMLRHWSNDQLFRAFAVPALLSTAVVLLMRRVMRQEGTPGSTAPSSRAPAPGGSAS